MERNGMKSKDKVYKMNVKKTKDKFNFILEDMKLIGSDDISYRAFIDKNIDLIELEYLLNGNGFIVDGKTEYEKYIIWHIKNKPHDIYIEEYEDDDNYPLLFDMACDILGYNTMLSEYKYLTYEKDGKGIIEMFVNEKGKNFEKVTFEIHIKDY